MLCAFCIVKTSSSIIRKWTWRSFLLCYFVLSFQLTGYICTHTILRDTEITGAQTVNIDGVKQAEGNNLFKLLSEERITAPKMRHSGVAIFSFSHKYGNRTAFCFPNKSLSNIHIFISYSRQRKCFVGLYIIFFNISCNIV